MRLDEAIVKHLDATERAALAAALGVEWAELPGENAGARAAALVTALGEAGRAAELIAALAAIRPEVPWAELPYPRDTLNHLHAALTRRHNLDGLRSLCFHLGLDYDDLTGEGKSGRARELVLALDRVGRTAELWTAYEPRETPYQSFSNRVAYLASRVPLSARNTSFILLLALLSALGWRLAAERGRTSAAGPPVGVAAGVATASPGATELAGAVASPTATTRPATSPTRTDVAAGTGRPKASPSATPTPAASPTSRPLLEVGYRGANLRRGPGPQFEIVATLRAGALLEAHGLSPSGEWIQVRYPGKGWPWIDADYATLPAGATLPVISLVASATAASAPEPPTPSPIATSALAGPPYYGLPPTAIPSPTRPPRPTTPPYYWATPTSPPP